MKLFKRLTIDGVEYRIISERVEQELSSYGRAEFVINADQMISPGLVQYDLGDHRCFFEVFKGWISNQEQTKPGLVKLVCRELSAVLDVSAKISLRHLTAIDLLKTIEDLSGLRFVVPDARYLSNRIPYFINRTNCRLAIENFDLFGIERGIWTQIPGGNVYWGSWDDSPFAKKSIIPIDDKARTFVNPTDRSFIIPTIPTLRPGMKIQNDSIIERTEIKGTKTRIQWLKLS